MLTKRPFARGIISLVLASALALGFILFPIRAAGLGEEGMGGALCAAQRTDSEIDSLVSSMIASGDYVEGEAIVCCLGSEGISVQSDDEASDLLAGAETLSSVTARQYAEATGESIPAATEQGLLTAQSEGESVRILKVCDYGLTTEQLLRVLLRDSRVLSAEPNYLMSFEEDGNQDLDDAQVDMGGQDAEEEAGDDDPLVPSDELGPALSDAQLDVDPHAVITDFTKYQWFSEGAGYTIPQYPNALNPGIHAPHWNNPSATNASGVVVIMDSGIDYTHPDLAGVMYHFSPELQAQLGCGEFGYAPNRDDVTDPMDGYDHGTHCAGIVAAQWNDFGVSGVANGVKLCAVATSRSVTDPSFDYATIIKGYDFMLRAVRAGVDIRAVNRSLSCTPTTNANDAMVKAAGELGIVTCRASGNLSQDLDKNYDDTSFDQLNPYVLRVDAADLQDEKPRFSNYGSYVTDLFAPGVAILSTVPTQESSRRYFWQADEDPLYFKTDFTESQLDVPFDKDVKVNSVSTGEFGADGDGSSLKVNVSSRVEFSSVGTYLDIPIGNLTREDMQDISLACNIGDFEAHEMAMRIQLDDGRISDNRAKGISSECDSAPGGWVIYRMHLKPQEMEQDLGYVTDSQGRRCIRVYAGGSLESKTIEPETEVDVDIYVDTIAIGGPGNSGRVPYAYMCGTSMATPIVTGSAAIVSSTIETDDLALRAAQTVRLLKGAVRQAKGYQGYCKQNGQLDLGLLGSADEYVPVIESACAKDDELVLKGAFFPTGGTVTVGGQQARVRSWSSESIEVAWPQGVTSGLIPITVRTDAGSEALRAFALAAPENVGDSAELYERDLGSLTFLGDREDLTGALKDMCAMKDGTLFALALNDNEGGLGEICLMRSDDQGASWRGVDLPEKLENPRIAASDDRLFIIGGTPPNSYAVKTWHLYGMDVENEVIEELVAYDTAEMDISACSLAFVRGNLYLIDSVYGPDAVGNYGINIRIRRFEDNYTKLGEAFLLNHVYELFSPDSAPRACVSGDSIYLCAICVMNRQPESMERYVGFERVDVAADGSLSTTDLSSALTGLDQRAHRDWFSISASDEGVFLVGRGLDGLLPEGAVYTDTFVYREGADAFEPYGRTLSFAPLRWPVSVCVDGWLYAYAVSEYEERPVFGRATRLREEPEPGPEPGPEPQPEPQPQPKPQPQPQPVAPAGQPKASSVTSTTTSKKLPKTGDEAMPCTLAATAGMLALGLGLYKRKDSVRTND